MGGGEGEGIVLGAVVGIESMFEMGLKGGEL